MKFKARMDMESLVVTTLVYTIFLSSILIVCFAKKLSGGGTSTFIGLLMLLIIGLISQKIKYYLVDEKSIQVVRLFYKIVFPLDKLNTVEMINYDSLAFSSRRFGINGVFGYSGIFTNSNYGTMKWYLTNKDQIVFFRLINGENIFLSPENPVLFKETILKNTAGLSKNYFTS